MTFPMKEGLRRDCPNDPRLEDYISAVKASAFLAKAATPTRSSRMIYAAEGIYTTNDKGEASFRPYAPEELGSEDD